MGSPAIFRTVIPFVLSMIAATPARAEDKPPTITQAVPDSATTSYLEQARAYEALLARYGHGIDTWNRLVSMSPPGYRVDYLGPYW